jgi:hypothetical protein
MVCLLILTPNFLSSGARISQLCYFAVVTGWSFMSLSRESSGNALTEVVMMSSLRLSISLAKYTPLNNLYAVSLKTFTLRCS